MSDEAQTVEPAALPLWGEEGPGTLVCRAVHQVTHDVRTFLFAPSEPAVFRHDAGQFVTLSLQIDGQPVNRCYTISTPPTRPDLLGITVKRQPGGLVSTWLHDHLEPGMRISADGPFGTFSNAATRARLAGGAGGGRYLFLSAGSGATPAMSMTRAAYDLGADDDILYVHSSRTPADILFRRELEMMTNLHPGIAVHHICEADAVGERWGGLRGRLDADKLRLLAPDLHERTVFCCGPAPYMQGARATLEELGFDMSRYHEETFTFEDLNVGELLEEGPTGSEAAAEIAQEEGVTGAPSYTVEFARSGRSFPCRPDELILDAAFTAGLTPSSSCGQGLCGTCKSLMLSGTVDMQHQGGIRPKEIAANKVLICCSKPTSDVSFDL